MARALGAIRPPSGGDGRERQIERQKREREGERPEWQGQASCWSLCVGVETLLGASGVDVVKLLLLLRLDVLVLLHSAGVLQVAPVGG